MTAKRFQCRYCDARFNRSEHFKRHERSHTGEKPFSCVICGMSFVRNDLMLRHGRLKHKVDLKKPPQPRAKTESTTTTDSSPPDVPAQLPPAPPEPEPIERTPIDIDVLFSSIDPTLDPSLYNSWPSLPTLSNQNGIFIDPLLTLPIPNTHELLMNSSFRDVVLAATQAMPQPPKVPSLGSLNRYVLLFMDKFLPHNPFLPPNFNTATANPLLSIAMASLGALYSVERKTALMLHNVSKHLEENLRSSIGQEDYPIWAIQALYLNTYFAAWSGFAKGVQFAISHMPILGMMSKGLHRCLTSFSSMQPDTKEWVEIETLRRTYFCIYILSGLVTLIFAAPPAVTTVDARGLALPCATSDWMAKVDAMNWIAPKSVLYDEVMIALWSKKPVHCSEFGVRILSASVFLEIWQAQHGHGSWLPEDWRERHYIVLECLHDFIESSWIGPPERGDPLTWNAMFILYGCYSRLATNTTFLEEGFSLSTGQAICQGLKFTYAHLELRDIDMRSTRAAFNSFTDIVRRGIKFISQTGCWSRGLEHALGGFQAGSFLVNWVRKVEEAGDQATPEEVQLFEEVRGLLEEGDIQIYPESLAATLARSCIQLMESAWIWGVTPLMGEAYRLYTEEVLGNRAAIMDVEPVLLEDEQGSEYGD